VTGPARVLGSLASTALVLALSACGHTPAAPTRPSGPPGVTRASEVYGPRCNDMPKSGPGSAEAMATQPAGTAISTTPLLTRLGIQLRLVGLDETLDKTDTQYTVFAPDAQAFTALSHLGDVSQVPGNPKDAFRALLSYQVVPKRYAARDLATAGSVTTLEGAPLAVSGDGLNLTIGAQHARVLCGNIPTLNATVFVIDQVLIPPVPPATLIPGSPLTPPSR
jgi:uncharacterized surface protein with fasciclin (FAS1) repeats